MAKKSNEVNYEDRFMDELVKRLDRQDGSLGRLEHTLEKVHTQVKATNGRVTKLEKINEDRAQTVRADDPPQTVKDLDPWYKDEKLIKLATLIVILGIIIASTISKVDIPIGIL